MSSEVTVFVPNKGGHDFSDALRYGELKFVTSGHIGKFSIGTMARNWAESLKESKEGDIILLSSLTTLSAIGCSMFARKHGCLNLLLFRNGQYIMRKLMIDDLISMEDL